jgi:transposase
LPATTQWEIVEEAAEVIKPARDELLRQAAQGEVLHNDDTGMRVLHLAREAGDQRTGVFTSGIVATMQGRQIALYFTGPKHAGENLAEVLKRRAAELPPLIQMSDALSRNVPKLPAGIEMLLARCLAHGRRQFVEVAHNFPDQCRYVLETLGAVYGYDAEARERGLSPVERLRFHQEHSQPLMDKLHAWLDAQFADRKTEPNSGLGKAITYLMRHWKGLTLFLREARAPLDNNLVERALKRSCATPQERIVLSDPERGAGRRPVHELDSHRRVVRCQLVRLPNRTAPGTGGQPGGVDAVELPRDASGR